LACQCHSSRAPRAARDPLRVAQTRRRHRISHPRRGASELGCVEEIVVKGAESAAVQDFNVADSVHRVLRADLVALGATNIAAGRVHAQPRDRDPRFHHADFFIRGVGLNDFGANSSSSVAIYQDDVAISSQALQLGTLFDYGVV
jgi:hypothetical protein